MQILENLPFDDYCKIEALSKHQLDQIAISIKYWQAKQLEKTEPTSAMKLGSAFHDLVLYGQEFFDQKYVLEPKFDLRFKEQKAAKEAFLADLKGRESLSPDHFEKIKCMSDALKEHPLAQALIDNTEKEVSLVTEKNSIKFKCRPDVLHENYILDLKVTSTLSADEFKRDFYKFRYDVQAAVYLDFFERKGQPFYFVVVQNQAPFDVVVYQVTGETIQNARQKYLQDLAKYILWRDGNASAGISDEVLYL